MRHLTRHACSFVAMLIAAVLIAPLSAGADEAIELSTAELVVIDRSLNGALVRITGEAIGEDLHADKQHRWVNVLGDSTAIGVYVTNESAEQVDVYGDHTHRGDTVEVVGIVNIACDQHGGEFDVHAEEFAVVNEGETVPRPVAPWKGIAGVAAMAVALVELRYLRHRRERTLT